MARSDDDIIKLFTDAVREVENKDLAGVSVTTNLASLGLDSVATMEVIGVMEERLKVQFPDEDLANLETMADLTALCRKAGA
jgi:acyl carrier protein